MKKTAEPTTGKAAAVNSTYPLSCYINDLLLPRLRNTKVCVYLVKCLM